MKILISACLLGEKVRYDGADSRVQARQLEIWAREGRLVPFCPEVAGGLPTPRPAAEITPEGRVRTGEGTDVTEAFRKGAELALALAKEHGIRLAILKEGSPSCGTHRLRDGSFSGRKIAGRGVTASLLAQNGIATFSELQIAEAAQYLTRLLRQSP